VGPVREQIEIAAPVERIWHAVHVDIASVPRWSKSREHSGASRKRQDTAERLSATTPASVARTNVCLL
jgi:hypothetical protein